ncbi:hypothetical protein GCM10007913_01490 [Devosia yakushimensis]|uniref:Uncharacterized protein n=1 Tax=Devosia yakushimensis TaxID=470028 RepID=A0ABQ5UA86_9HYPH|nr:hypothetical protein [Devosia yakushimensis]GLQ08217.1 hypothetical protein GCM10007913_01490 [Devosia yakushimensis]
MSISRSIAVALVLATGLAAGAAQANDIAIGTGLSELAIIIVGGKGGDVSLNPQPLPPGIVNPWVRQGLNPQPLPPGRGPATAVRPGFWQGSNPDELVPGRMY